MNQPIADHVSREVRIPIGPASLTGDLGVPAGARGIVLFAHGSGSSRQSPRNVWVATRLQNAGIATLLFDLLTSGEEARDLYTRQHRFDIPLLAERLTTATRWVDAQPELRKLHIGYFGASTGSAAALLAAAEFGQHISAVVSRGGRPDLAGSPALAKVEAATLLIVGSLDDAVLALNQQAYQQLTAEKRLVTVPGASHLFEESGTLEKVATLATEWFAEYFIVHRDR